MPEIQRDDHHAFCPHCGHANVIPFEALRETPQREVCVFCRLEFLCWAERKIVVCSSAIEDEPA